VSIATVARDVATVTGIQSAITLYTLVMAAFMITGGKIGAIIGRKRVFMIGCVVYGIGSFLTAISHSLGLLLLGWSVLEGLGAALIMPAVVALVATNFDPPDRPRVYGLVASAAAIAAAVGPLVGGLFTTYASWRWVFAGEVLIVICLLGLTTRLADTPPEGGVRLDPVGTVLSAAGLGLVVYGIIRTGTWGFVVPKPDVPEGLGVSLCLWLMLGGAIVLAAFIGWESWRIRRGRAALVDPAMLRVPKLQAALLSFFFQFLLQAGLFFVVHLFLSIAAGALRRRHGCAPSAAFPRVLVLSGARADSLTQRVSATDPARRIRNGVPGPVGPGSGAGPGFRARGHHRASHPGRDRDRRAGAATGCRHGLGRTGREEQRSGWAPIHRDQPGGVHRNRPGWCRPDLGVDHHVPLRRRQQSRRPTRDVVQGAGRALGRIPFVSDAQLQSALQSAGVPSTTAQAVTDQNAASRINGLRASIALLALIALIALAMTRRLPVRPVGVEGVAPAEADEDRERARPPPALPRSETPAVVRRAGV
jgi:MFS family permease